MTTTITYETDHICYYCEECDQQFDYLDVDYIGGLAVCPNKDYGDDEHVINYIDCDCSDYTEQNIAHELARWTHANPSPEDLYLITGNDMGWMRRSGCKITEIDYDHPTGMMGVDSDFTQRWEFEKDLKGSEVSIIQSHHDAPTGESYTMKPLSPMDYLLYLESERYDDFDNIVYEHSSIMEHMPEEYSGEYPTANKKDVTFTSETFGPDRTYWTAHITIGETTFDIVDESEDDARDRMDEAIDILNSYAEGDND